MLLTADIAELSQIDPLLCNLDFSLRARLFPLGFPLDITTNCQEILAAAEQSWGQFQPTFDVDPISLRIGVAEGDMESEKATRLTHPIFRAYRNILTIAQDSSNFAACELTRGFGFAWLTPAVARDREYLRYLFLDAMILSLLEARYITSVHSACLSFANQGFLFCGDSGAGKSTLSFACAKRGWTYLTDDGSSLITGRNDRMVLGNHHEIRFREDAANLFPELRRWTAIRRGNGKLTVPVPVKELPWTTANRCAVRYLIFLKRGDAGACAELRPCPKEEAARWLRKLSVYGDDDMRRRKQETLESLLSAEIYELHYRDLQPAIDRLESLARDEMKP